MEPSDEKKPEKTFSIDDIERILSREERVPVEILPNGEIREKDATDIKQMGGIKPFTMRENLGGEY